jgi:Putative transposase/Transposase zinc-binding domain
MKYRDPLKTILSQTRPHWDRDETRPSARRAFRKVMQCRTLALGAEVYASETEETRVYHTCKSRACSSCGNKTTIDWRRDREAALPDGPYKGITFTMPDLLWSFFCDNRFMVAALSGFAVNAIQTLATARQGLEVGIITFPQTFNGRLEFNPHVHTMVTAGGLHASSGSWKSRFYYDGDLLMRLWRGAVIQLLRTALRAGRLVTDLTVDQMEDVLIHLERCWWSVKVQSAESKDHRLRYDGRYLRRPPIAQRRITSIGEQSVTFRTKDKKSGSWVEVEYSLEEFVDRWAQHVSEHCQHGVRYFGLFAPRKLGQISAALFTILGQERRPRPGPLSWAHSLKQDFGTDPLLDHKGQRMRWVRRLAPEPRVC